MANAKRCFPHRHMTPEEYGLWYYCRCVSKNSAVVYLSGREIAKEFEGISKNVIYRIGESLTAKGWLRDLAPYHRNSKTGTLVPRTVYALSHEEWVEQYSDIGCRLTCPPVPKSGQDDSGPVPISASPVPKTGHSCPDSGTDLSRNREQRIKEVESKKKREREGSKNEQPRALSNTENGGQVKDVAAWMLSLDPPLRFAPASKDREHPSTKSIIARRLREGIPVSDIKSAISLIPLDRDPNPSFAVRDSLDAAIDRLLKDREKARQTQELIARTTAQERARAESELAEVLARNAAENALVEETLPPG